jgi:hypothetical protein
MNALLLREVFTDPKASAQAAAESSIVQDTTARTAHHYIQLANENVANTSSRAVSVSTMTLEEYRALVRAKKLSSPKK